MPVVWSRCDLALLFAERAVMRQHRGASGAEHSHLVCTGLVGLVLQNQLQTKSLKIQTKFKPNKLDFKPIRPFSKLRCKPIRPNSS